VKGHTTLGEGNRVFPNAVIGEIPQDLKYRGEPTRLVIGDRNTFRECATINLGTVQGGGVTTIGNGCLFMAYSHVGHDCTIGDGAIIANSVALAGHVLLEDHVHFGGLSAAQQFSRVGRLAFVGGMTGINMDVAPYCTAAGGRGELTGLNTIGLQRAGMTEEQISRVKQAYKIVFRSNLQLADAIAQVRAELGTHPEIAHFAAFLETSKRGILR
jgi:UDP-N-acetylglucosamine acyltransferase